MKYTLLKNKETGARSIRNNKNGEVVVKLENPDKYLDLRKKALKNLQIAARDQSYSDCGFTKVRGSVSGKVYWE